MSDFHRGETRRARKPHTCEECSRTIEPGEQYTHARGRFDGDGYVWQMCAHCMAAWRIANLEGDLNEWIGVGELVDEWREWAAQDPALLRLAVGVKRRWRRSDGALMPTPDLLAGAR